MLNDKVLLTYKRKRFSFQTDFSHDTKSTNCSPNLQSGSSWVSSPKSECDANDEKHKNHHSGKFQCSTCNSRYGFTESMLQHVPAINGMSQSQITGQKDMGPMVLRSRRVLSSIKVENTRQATSSTLHESGSNMKDIIQMDGSGRKSGLDFVTCAEESETALLAVHDRMGNPINLNMNLATEGGGYSCGYPEVGAKTSLHSDNGDNVSCNDGALKDHSNAHLITFSRRSKTKHNTCERITDRNLKIAEKQSFSAICSSRVVGANFSCQGSSQKRIFEEQVNSTPILLQNCVVSSSQVDVADEMANVKVDATSDYPAEVCNGSRIMKRLETSSEFLMPALSAVDTCEELSKEFLAVQPVYVVKDYICPLNTEPSNSGNNVFSLSVEESGSKLITCTNYCEKSTINCLSEERDSSAVMEQSVAPTSVCQMNLKANKRSNYVVPENHRDSQSSSTPCCSIVFTDEENDARSKEIEWLEGLDNVLREKKKDRGTCSLIIHGGIDCREGFNPMMPNKPAEQSVNNPDMAIDFVNPLNALPEKNSLANLPDPICEGQLKTEKSTSSDFPCRYLPSNPNLQLDLNTTAASSGSHFRDNFYMPDLKLMCSSNGNPSLFKQKQITENAVTEMMLGGKQGSLSDKSKRYSSEWSEEELDFLWLGVRRHGLDSWNDILGNPKLQFARSRLPEDLALQWEQEEKKLFNGILFRPARLSKPRTFYTPLLDGTYAKAHAYVDNPLCTAETKLSLGDVYLHKENIAKSSQSGVTYPLTSECSSTCPLLGNYLSMSSYPGSSIRQKKSSVASRTTFQMDYGSHKQFRSGHEQNPAGLPAGTNLPHWLKEACSAHPSPSDLPWPPFLTAGNATSFANNDTGLCSPTSKHGEPLMTSKDLRGRGILKRKSLVSSKNRGAIKIEEASAASIGESVLGIKPSLIPKKLPASEKPALGIGASHQKNITDLSISIPVPIAPTDLVVLDSDVSSEETISDDQNGRPL